jgi:hypothetical protein
MNPSELRCPEICAHLFGQNTTQSADTKQEFSIEIPDKDADAIHSGKLNAMPWISFRYLRGCMADRLTRFVK